jgi:hypothetical protein
MVKKAIIIQVLILGLLALVLVKPYFFDIRLKEAQKELDFWKLIRKAASDTAYFNRLDVSKGKFLIIGYGSFSNESSPLFKEIEQNQQKIGSYTVIAISPFEKRKFDTKRDSAFTKYITFKYNEMDIDIILRGIPFTTIPEFKEQRVKAKAGERDLAVDYPVVIVLNNNKIVWAKKRVSDFSEIKLN